MSKLTSDCSSIVGAEPIKPKELPPPFAAGLAYRVDRQAGPIC